MAIGKYLKSFGNFVASLYTGKMTNSPSYSRIFDGEKYSNKAERVNAYQHWKWEKFGLMPVFFADNENAIRKENQGWDEEDEKAEKEKDRYELTREKILKRRNNEYLFSRKNLESMPGEKVSQVSPSEYKSSPAKKPYSFFKKLTNNKKYDFIEKTYNKIVDYFSPKKKENLDYSLDRKFEVSGKKNSLEKQVQSFNIFDTSKQLDSLPTY